MSDSHPKGERRQPPTAQERVVVRIEGNHSPGWLRSRFMKQAWPRPGLAPCGRATCKICDRKLPHADEARP